MKLKPTALVLLAVLVILAGVFVAGGSRLYRQATAPRVDPDASLPPITATDAASATEWQAHSEARPGALSPAETVALREAFAVLLQRTRLLVASEETLLAYDRSSSIAAAQAYVADDYAWPLLESDFVFIYGALGPENSIVCDAPERCRITQAVLDIQAVLIFDKTVCASLGATPCLTSLSDEQIDARDNLITADFRRDGDGRWRLVGWETLPLPPAPTDW